MYVVNRTKGTYLGVEIAVANTLRTRMLGLYARRRLHLGDGVWLVPCNSVQTIGMRCPVDVIFLDAVGSAVRVHQNVVPGRVIWPVRRAHSALEVPAGAVQSSETQIGDQIEFVEDLDHPGSGGAQDAGGDGRRTGSSPPAHR